MAIEVATVKEVDYAANAKTNIKTNPVIFAAIKDLS